MVQFRPTESAIAQDHPIRPVVMILISLEYLIGDRMLRITEEVKLYMY
jgi:hypothetical protein